MPSSLLPMSTGLERFPVAPLNSQTSGRISVVSPPAAGRGVSSALSSKGLSALCDSSLAELERIAPTSSFPKGAVLYLEGQASRGVYILCQGRVKLMAAGRDGKTLILRIAQPGEILGLQSMASGSPYELTVETLQPCQLAFINRAEFIRFLREHPDAALHMAQQLSNECQAAYEILRSVALSQSVPEKLARLLLQWAGDGLVRDGFTHLKLTLTHEEIAQLIGSTRETVTRTLSEMKKQRVLDRTGATLLIRDRAALERLARA